MADEFLTKTKCDHGGASLDGGRIMSRFDTACNEPRSQAQQ